MNKEYKDKVRLLLSVMPIVMDEPCFAVHGGTAINLFVTDMPRLSIDVDLTYIPLEDRETSLAHIGEALSRISMRVERLLKGAHVVARLEISKLTCEYHGNQVKIEVNQTKRGIVGGEPIVMPLCSKAQKMFEMEVEARIVPLTLLYGGKMAAALSRQHPRDMFDIRQMPLPLSDAKRGFIFCLLGSDRPLHESLAPNLINQKEAMENQFAGMSDIPFLYADFEETRCGLIADACKLLTEEDRRFLVSFERGEPDWSNIDYKEFEHYPSVKWKLLNISKLKRNNPQKLQREADCLMDVLRSS